MKRVVLVPEEEFQQFQQNKRELPPGYPFPHYRHENRFADAPGYPFPVGSHGKTPKYPHGSDLHYQDSAFGRPTLPPRVPAQSLPPPPRPSPKYSGNQQESSRGKVERRDYQNFAYKNSTSESSEEDDDRHNEYTHLLTRKKTRKYTTLPPPKPSSVGRWLSAFEKGPNYKRLDNSL